MQASVSTIASTGTTTASNVSAEYPMSAVSPSVGANSSENTTATALVGTMATNVTTLYNATTTTKDTDITNTTMTTMTMMINATTAQMTMVNGTTSETMANTTTTSMSNTTTIPTTFPGNTSSSANETRTESNPPTMTTTSPGNQTTTARPNTTTTIITTTTTRRTTPRPSTLPSTVTPPTGPTYTAAQTTWSVPSRGPGATTVSPGLLAGKHVYIGAGAVAASVMLIIILASVFCSRRRKHSKCRKLAADDGNINAYEVEMASRLGADNIGATLVESDDVAEEDKPEMRNYFQDGLHPEEYSSGAGDGETPEGRAVHPGEIKTEDRLSVGPMMLSDASGSTQETYDRAYSSHDTFKNW